MHTTTTTTTTMHTEITYCSLAGDVLDVLLIGKLGASPRDIAHVMTEAVVEFAAKSPVHLKNITVCIFQSQMVQEFADAVANKTSSSGWQQTVKGVVCSALYHIVLICLPAYEDASFSGLL